MAPRASKQKGKAIACCGGPSTAAAAPPVQAPWPINTEVLEALQILWDQINEFTVLNLSSPFLTISSHLWFIKNHLPMLVSNLFGARLYFNFKVVFLAKLLHGDE
jgi:hypothetical protein